MTLTYFFQYAWKLLVLWYPRIITYVIFEYFARPYVCECSLNCITRVFYCANMLILCSHIRVSVCTCF